MADYDDGFKRETRLEEKTGPQLLLELGKILAVFAGKALKFALRMLVRFILFVIEAIHNGCLRLIEWWNDNDTQEKVAAIKAKIGEWWRAFCAWSKRAAIAALRWLVKAAKASWKWLKIAAKATFTGLLHLKTTFSVGWTAFVAWTKRCRSGCKLWWENRKIAYHRFRQNGGVKVLLINAVKAVGRGINSMMEEDQDEPDPDAVMEDDLIREEIERRISGDSKAARLGQRIMSKARGITEGGSEKEKNQQQPVDDSDITL